LRTATIDYRVAPAIVLALVPDELSPAAAAQPMRVSPLTLTSGRGSIKGWYSGTAIGSQDTLAVRALARIRSMNELYALEKVGEVSERMTSGKARFHAVLTAGQQNLTNRTRL
jgi:D-arabinose 1-dehydrogenase-like Zn-dependent alcohol dehydrogenase